MRLIRILLRLLSPIRLVKAFCICQDRRSYYKTLSRVTRLESAQDLHDKIRALDKKLHDLYFA